MITKQLTNTYLITGTPNILAIEIAYQWWIFQFKITKATKINKSTLSSQEIEVESCKLFSE